jgi:hypothetical protein
MHGSLRTLADYERCAREACVRVRHVKVEGPGTNRRIPNGTVRVRVSRSWWRALSQQDLHDVRTALVARKPIMVMLELETP